MALVVLEVFSLLWSHPILTGLLILLFTTPLFHIVLFFTPLLMSTTLCVMALVSIGPQIDKIREERHFKMSLGFRSLEHQHQQQQQQQQRVNRFIAIRQGRPQRPPMRLVGGAGGQRWSDWVKGVEVHGHTVWLSESHLMQEIAEDGLKSDVGEGIPIISEDFCSKGAYGSENLLQIQQQEQQQEQQEQDLANVEMGIVKSRPIEEPKSEEEDNAEEELVPVPESTAVVDRRLLSPSDARFVLATTASEIKMPARKMSWFRRRRIPCISKALGKLRDKICIQLRRIFT